MKTKLFKSMNLIRRGNGASLNLFRYTAMLLCVLTLGVGNAWGTSTTYYAKLTADVATGKGKVYVAASGSTGSFAATSSSTQSNSSTGSSANVSFQIGAQADNGYYFVNWTGNNKPSTATSNPGTVTISSSNSKSPGVTGTVSANFAEITINNPTAITVNTEDNLPTSEANIGSIVFTTKGDNLADFKATPDVTKTAGFGTFTQTGFSVATNGNATVDYKFVGTGRYGGTDDPASRTRSNSATYTITSLPGNNSGTCTVTFKFPNITIGEGSFEHMTTINTVPRSATATFPVQWVDDELDFSASFGSVTGGGVWTVDEPLRYNATDGTISIDYTFNPQSAIGNHSAVLTLSANPNAGGASKTLTLTAESEKLADNDASIGETEYKTLAEAITAANEMNTNPTVKILRNIEGLTSTLEIKKPMTIDLNSFTVSGTLTSSVNKLFYLNTATAVLTINDSRNGGKISATGNAAAALYAVLADKGSVVLTKGDIEINNTNTGASANAIAVCIMAGARFGMTGGNLNAVAVGTGAYGVMTTTNPADVDMIGITGGTITAAAATTGVGIYCKSSSTTLPSDPTNANVALSGVTIDASATGATAHAVQTDAGVILGINSGTYNATVATTTARAVLSKGYTAVMNGTFNATAGTTDANAIRVEAGIVAVRAGLFNATTVQRIAHAGYVANGAKLLTYGGTFHGKSTTMIANGYATGTQVVSGGTLEAQGGTFIGEAANTGLGAAQTSYAIGVFANTGSNVTLANATLRGLTDNTYVNGAYALYTSTVNPVSLTNCTLEATSTDQYAYGVRLEGGATPLTMNNCTVNATAATLYAYGFYQNNATSTIDVTGSTFNVTSNGTRAYGIYVNAGTSFSATDCDFTVRTLQNTAGAAAESYLRGIFVAAGKQANLTGCTFNVSGHATYSTNAYGLYISGSVNVENTDVTVSSVKSGYAILNDGSTTAINIFSGKFSATTAESNATAVAAKQQLYGGFYVHNNNLAKYLPEGYMVETLTAGTEFNAGYKYHVRPETVVNDPVCKIGSTGYATLEEALEFVNKNSGNAYTIYMVKNYTLPAGNYTLPAKATLLVPYKTGTGAGATTAIGKSPDRVTSYTQPECFRRLILADGVNLIVNGTIEVSAQMACTGQGNGKNGYTTGGYGLLQLLEGSKIDLNDGAKLMVWGFVAGERVSSTSYKRGSIEAKRGAKIYQGFQIGDWKGGSAVMFGGLLSNGKELKAFPINQYFVMNIEVPVLYRPGAEQYGATGVDVSGLRGVDEVPIVGVPKPNDLTHQALFLLEDVDVSEDTWIIEDYDPLTDRWIFTMNSSAKIGSLNVNVSGYAINSKDYVLPITHCMKLHMLSGDLAITQSTVFLPGVELEIDKEAEVVVNSGQTLYFVDQDSWGKIAGHAGDAYYLVPWYSPAWKTQGTGGAIPTGITQSNCPRYIAAAASRPALPDALLNLHGKITVNGALHTSDGGANIFSSNEDAGTINFVTAASGNSNLYFFWKLTGSSYNTNCVFTNNSGWTQSTVTTSAKLKNGDDTYESTAGTVAGKTWMYYDNKWNCWEERGCFTYDAQDLPYAKPAAYVQLTSDTEDANHLYTDAATGNRRFLVDADCVWWEVEPTPYDGNKYKCVTPDHNGKYKYYEYVSGWQEATVTITWSINGTNTNYTVLYGNAPKYLSASPSKASTATDYYTWLGWTKGTETGEFYAKDAELPVATENTTYYAYFKADKFTFRATFNNYDGSFLESKLAAVGETPVYEGETPVKPATTSKEYTFTGWNPTLAAISNAPVTYTAQFSEKTREYTITWANYDGTVLKTEKVAYDTTPSAPTVTPTRPNDDYYTYTFNEWSPAVSAVTGNQTYTATYNYEKKVTKHEVTFKNGSTTIYSQNLVENSVPVFDGNEPTKEATAQYSYTFDGWSTTDGGALAYASGNELPALTADVTYYAHFAASTNTYKVYWRSEDGKVLYETDNAVTYNDTPSYDGTTPTKDRVGKTGYEFDGWSASIGSEKLASLPNVTEDKVFYAHFLEGTYYNITFSANEHGTAPAGYEAIGGSKLDAPEEPTETGYTFGGWYKESDCTNEWDFATETVTGNTTLFAQWTPNTNTKYTVKHWQQNIENYEYTEVTADQETKQGTTATATAATAKSYTGFTAQPISQETIAGDGTTVVNIYYNRNTYTIKWMDMQEILSEHELAEQQYKYGDIPSYTYNKPSDDAYSYVVTGWSPSITPVKENATYIAIYNAIPKHMVVNSEVTIPGDVDVVTTTVKVSGHLTINDGATLSTTNLILEASSSGSGDIEGANRVQLKNGGKAYFDYNFNTDPWHWSAFGVPFEIDLKAAAPLKETTTPMVLGSDYDIVYYDSDERAAHGPSSKCWKYVEYDAERKLTPGKLYMIAFNRPVGHVNVVRFTKAAEAAIDFTADVPLSASGTGDNNNWNGIANPRMYHALLDAGVSECQVHDGGEIGKDGYHTYTMKSGETDYKFFVGKAAFVQVPVGKSVMTTEPAMNQSAIVAKAPRRAKAQEGADRYDVQIAPMAEEMSDRVFLLTDEDKADEYVIVSDLAKAGVSPVRPQMWVNRYGVKLCKNTVAMRNNVADYPLGISVPADGSYDIFLEERPNNDDMLYLTYDGEAIWNLSYGACTIDLPRGTNDHYGLRVVAKSPQVATGIEETTIQNGDAVRKVIVEDKVFIIRNGQIFGIDGRLAK